MCGIVGYIGKQPAAEFLLDGLRRLEYRGYDSAGIVTMPRTGELDVAKTVGRIDNLAEQLSKRPLTGSVGIGHTRWATHGAPTQPNAHPHFGGERAVAIAHNGVIENYMSLKTRLESEGYTFQSATDSPWFSAGSGAPTLRVRAPARTPCAAAAVSRKMSSASP